ncbi:T6SS immunity protein Tli4 family protein [Massilia aerilata]|uniref:T6SS immunity protein Tli4 family protein n=1 Tax=Massilia aerilata TaxID=453817 RepID=A0ABW0S622_9BURK
MRANKRSVLAGCVALLMAASLMTCSKTYAYKEKAVPEPVALSPRLKNLFKETKLVCFGRYALTVPKEAQVTWGTVSFPSKIYLFKGDQNAIKILVDKNIAKLKFADDDADITYNGRGPIEGSWQMRYYESKAAKKLNLHFFNTYVNKGDLIFLLGGEIEDGQSEEQALALANNRAKSLRLRTEDEVPSDEGYCIEQGFMASSSYGDQEMVNVGIHLPSIPDVSFSISSNKDAYADYSKEEFARMKVEELSLLARIHGAQKEQGLSYPLRTLLREGKRNVQHWHGEESLIRRTDGVHDFEWGFVGTPKDVANPSEFLVNMYTKVEHNTVGAAKAASLSDDEAVALWDKLLSGLKFRVKVPSAPEGSYFIPPGKADTAAASQ